MRWEDLPQSENVEDRRDHRLHRGDPRHFHFAADLPSASSHSLTLPGGPEQPPYRSGQCANTLTAQCRSYGYQVIAAPVVPIAIKPFFTLSPQYADLSVVGPAS